MYWCGQVLSTQLPCQFERDECAHAMSKECKGHIQHWTKDMDKLCNKWLNPHKWSFCQAILTSRGLDGAHLNCLWKRSSPHTKNRGASTCIWDTQ